jgi:beta-glucosidase
MRQRFEQSAIRLLRNIFNVGLFENPYLDVAETEATVGNPEFMKAGYEAQLRSVVMLKNHADALPLEKQLKVYVPQKFIPASTNWFGQETSERWEDAASPDIVNKYFEWVDSPDEADVALVFIDSPQGGTGYSLEDVEKDGNGYVPINLQYEDYVATDARDESIAGGSPFEDFTNRSYKGKTGTSANSYDQEMVNDTKAKMGAKPVIVIIDVSNPMVMRGFEENADAILVHFGVQNQAVLDIITGSSEPSALLPFQMPASMKTVDMQYEDVPRDMESYEDEDGNRYDFAFGLNWEGVINDERVEQYR